MYLYYNQTSLTIRQLTYRSEAVTEIFALFLKDSIKVSTTLKVECWSIEHASCGMLNYVPYIDMHVQKLLSTKPQMLMNGIIMII